ncbi:hypothetical protein ISCGN_001045 [Ixodes scapularis]
MFLTELPCPLVGRWSVFSFIAAGSVDVDDVGALAAMTTRCRCGTALDDEGAKIGAATESAETTGPEKDFGRSSTNCMKNRSGFSRMFLTELPCPLVGRWSVFGFIAAGSVDVDDVGALAAMTTRCRCGTALDDEGAKIGAATESAETTGPEKDFGRSSTNCMKNRSGFSRMFLTELPCPLVGRWSVFGFIAAGSVDVDDVGALAAMTTRCRCGTALDDDGAKIGAATESAETTGPKKTSAAAAQTA